MLDASQRADSEVESTRLGTDMLSDTYLTFVDDKGGDNTLKRQFEEQAFDSVVSEEGTMFDPKDQQEYNLFKSSALAFLSALFYGLANYILDSASKKYGNRTQIMQIYSLLVMAPLFHFFKWIKHTYFEKKECAYFSYENSSYFDKVTNPYTGEIRYKLNKLKCFVPMFRGAFQGLATLMVTLCYYYAN